MRAAEPGLLRPKKKQNRAARLSVRPAAAAHPSRLPSSVRLPSLGVLSPGVPSAQTRMLSHFGAQVSCHNVTQRGNSGSHSVD